MAAGVFFQLWSGAIGELNASVARIADLSFHTYRLTGMPGPYTP